MSCRFASENELAERYLNGQLEPHDQDSFETHILECADCLGYVEILQGLRTELSTNTPTYTPAPKVVRFSPWRRWWQLASVAAVAACGILVLQFSLSRPNRPAVVPNQQVTVKPAPSVTEPTVTATGPAAQEKSEPDKVANATEALSKPPANTAAHERNSATAQAKEPATGQVVGGESAQPSRPELAVATAATNTQTEAPKTSAVTQQPTKPKPPSLTTDQGVELYHLGEVRPPQYTFPGLAQNAKLPSGAPAGAYSEGGAGVRGGFQDAMLAYVEGDYRVAGKMLESLVQKEPDSAEKNYYLGICRLMLGHPAEAVAPLKVATNDTRSSMLQAAHFYLAKAYLQTGDLAQAESELKASVAVPGRMSGDAKSLLTRVQAFRAATGQQ